MRFKLVDRERAALVALAAERLGSWTKAPQLVDTLTGWEVTVRKHGRAITVEEFAENWALSRATAYRRVELVRQAFPEIPARDPTPNFFLRPLIEQLEAGETDLPKVMGWVQVSL